GREDLLGEVPRGVGLGGGEARRRGRLERETALMAEAVAGGIRRLTRGTGAVEPRPAATAEAGPRGIVLAAARTGHRHPVRSFSSTRGSGSTPSPRPRGTGMRPAFGWMASPSGFSAKSQ